MIDINLLPKAYRRPNIGGYIRDYFSLIGMVFVIVVLGNALIVTLGANRLFALQQAQGEWDSRKQKAADLAKLKEDINGLRNKVQALKQYAGKEESLSSVLYDIYKQLPMNMWLTSLDYTGKTMTLHGESLDMDRDASLSVKDYVEKLNKSVSAKLLHGEFKVGDLVRETLGEKSVISFVIVLERKEGA